MCLRCVNVSVVKSDLCLIAVSRKCDFKSNLQRRALYLFLTFAPLLYFLPAASLMFFLSL